MSFALEYRKKMQADARKAVRQKKAVADVDDTGFVVLPPKKNVDTRGNRRRVLAALSLAGIILSVLTPARSSSMPAGWVTTRSACGSSRQQKTGTV